MASDISYEAFEQLARQEFSYLESDFGFHAPIRGKPITWTPVILSYRNSTTGVDVAYSEEFVRCDVALVRLVAGAPPPHPVFVSDVPVLDHFNLDQLLLLRAPRELAAITPHEGNEHDGLTPAQMATSLRLRASALRDHGSDILRGDFSSFAEMEREVRARLVDHPEKVIVWTPAGTSTDEIVGELQGAHPNIETEVRTYRLPQGKQTLKGSAAARLRAWLAKLIH